MAKADQERKWKKTQPPARPMLGRLRDKILTTTSTMALSYILLQSPAFAQTAEDSLRNKNGGTELKTLPSRLGDEETAKAVAQDIWTRITSYYSKSYGNWLSLRAADGFEGGVLIRFVPSRQMPQNHAGNENDTIYVSERTRPSDLAILLCEKYYQGTMQNAEVPIDILHLMVRALGYGIDNGTAPISNQAMPQMAIIREYQARFGKEKGLAEYVNDVLAGNSDIAEAFDRLIGRQGAYSDNMKGPLAYAYYKMLVKETGRKWADISALNKKTAEELGFAL